MTRFLIISASGRAIAQSAQKAEYKFDVADLFADWDLINLCRESPSFDNRVIRIQRFSDVFDWLESQRYDGAVIGGGFETRLDLVERLESLMPVLGCTSKQLGRLHSVDSIERIGQLAEQSGAKWPITLDSPPGDSDIRKWLSKKLHGSGGRHVCRYDPHSDVNLLERLPSDQRVFQQFVEGQNYSAVFAASDIGEASSTELMYRSNQSSAKTFCQLIGCSQQLVGERELGASPFSYCGSVGPIYLSVENQTILENLGARIADEFEIQGLFGIDFILNSQGLWPVDINPRIPASAEIYELAWTDTTPEPFSIFRSHVRCCQEQNFRLKTAQPVDAYGLVGKAILFCNERDGYFVNQPLNEQLQSQWPREQNAGWIAFADMPNEGTSIQFGEPVLTILAKQPTAELAQAALFESARKVYGILRSQRTRQNF